jgi:hypothetical protein
MGKGFFNPFYALEAANGGAAARVISKRPSNQARFSLANEIFNVR